MAHDYYTENEPERIKDLSPDELKELWSSLQKTEKERLLSRRRELWQDRMETKGEIARLMGEIELLAPEDIGAQAHRFAKAAQRKAYSSRS